MQLLGGLGAGLAIIVLLAAWQFQKGPVSLSILTPHVERALNKGHRSFRLAIEDTTLAWAGWDRALELRVKNVRAIGENGVAQARIPELSMSLSAKALLHGTLAPKFIELLGPDLRVRRGPDGDFGFEVTAGDDQSDGAFATGLLGWLLKKPEPGSPMSYLQTLRINGATMTYVDSISGKAWDAPVGYLRLDRAAHGLLAEGSVLIEIDDRVSDVSLHGSFHTESRRLDVTASFADIEPASFAALDPNLARLDMIGLPLSGTVIFGISLKDGVDTVGFKVTGDDGIIDLPEPLAQSLAIKRLEMNGVYSGRNAEVTFDKLDIELISGSQLRVPEPVNHAFPLQRIEGSGIVDLKSGYADVENLVLDLAGPRLELTARAQNVDSEVVISANAKLSDVPVNELTTYWPSALGVDAYNWVTTHLKDGRLIEANTDGVLRVAADGNHSLVSLDGTMSAEGVTVTYLESMPEVKGVNALMTFDADTFDVAIERGESGPIKLAGGTVHINGLREIDQYIDINLHAESPLKDALELIDRKPFEFASAMKIDPNNALGDSAVNLSLRFMLAKDLGVDDVTVKASAKLKNVAIENVVLGRGIKDGKLLLNVDNKSMQVNGEVQMGKVPVALTWDEQFGEDAPYRSQYVMAARIDDLADVRDLGVDPGPAGDFVSGGIESTVRYTIFDDRRGRVDVSGNLERAELRVPVMEWRKTAGDAGWFDVTILLENGLVKNVPSFNVTAGDLEVKGDVTYSPGGLGLERVNLKKVLFGRTDVSGAVISRPDGGWEIGLQGRELDFRPLWEKLIRDRPGQDDFSLPNLTIAVELKKMWVENQKFMSDVSGTFVHRGGFWRTALLDSKMNGGPVLSVNMAPDNDGNRVLVVSAQDAGEALRFFDLFENMYGGRLEIRGRYDDAAGDRPLRGKLRVRDYRVRNAPMLTRILSIMALTGILDAMTGEGLSFSELDVPFKLTDGEIELTDAKATGTSLGFTSSGTIYTHADVLNLTGTVVPAYAINSFLGKIPLLGNILTGNEEGGGVFAANFAVSGPIEDPKTTVNPLSALTPGILRNLFGAIAGEKEPALSSSGADVLAPATPAQ